MNYDQFLQAVEHLDFIRDRQEADAATKAVLGIFSSRLREPQARHMDQQLPFPLTEQRLRGHQAKTVLAITVPEYVAEIAVQFHINDNQALELIRTVLHQMKETVDNETMAEIENSVSPDWNTLLKNA